MLVQIDGSAQLALAICDEFIDYRKRLRIKGKGCLYRHWHRRSDPAKFYSLRGN